MSIGLSGSSAKMTAARLAPEKWLRPMLRPLIMSLTQRRANERCIESIMPSAEMGEGAAAGGRHGAG